MRLGMENSILWLEVLKLVMQWQLRLKMVPDKEDENDSEEETDEIEESDYTNV